MINKILAYVAIALLVPLGSTNIVYANISVSKNGSTNEKYALHYISQSMKYPNRNTWDKYIEVSINAMEKEISEISMEKNLNKVEETLYHWMYERNSGDKSVAVTYGLIELAKKRNEIGSKNSTKLNNFMANVNKLYKNALANYNDGVFNDNPEFSILGIKKLEFILPYKDSLKHSNKFKSEYPNVLVASIKQYTSLIDHYKSSGDDKHYKMAIEKVSELTSIYNSIENRINNVELKNRKKSNEKNSVANNQKTKKSQSKPHKNKSTNQAKNDFTHFIDGFGSIYEINYKVYEKNFSWGSSFSEVNKGTNGELEFKRTDKVVKDVKVYEAYETDNYLFKRTTLYFYKDKLFRIECGFDDNPENLLQFKALGNRASKTPKRTNGIFRKIFEKFGKGERGNGNDYYAKWQNDEIIIFLIETPNDGYNHVQLVSSYKPITMPLIALYQKKKELAKKEEIAKQTEEIVKKERIEQQEEPNGQLPILTIVFVLLTLASGFWAYQQLVMWWSSLTAGESITWNLGSVLGWSGATLVFAGITYLIL
ncbi:hypothetical protein ACFL36_01225 [Thermodesulfobacteriota bacterium]